MDLWASETLQLWKQTILVTLVTNGLFEQLIPASLDYIHNKCSVALTGMLS